MVHIQLTYLISLDILLCVVNNIYEQNYPTIRHVKIVTLTAEYSPH